MSEQLFGWVVPKERTRIQTEYHETVMAQTPRFQDALQGSYREANGQFFLWEFSKRNNGGKHIRYVNQTSGSCVGSAAFNMLMTLAAIEIVKGDPEEWPKGHAWWPYTYGQSRRRAGMSGRGEGSFGSAWADAIVKDGIFSREEAAAENKAVPDYEYLDGWIRLPKSTEMEWSDGAAKNAYVPLGRKHPVKSAARIRSSDEAKAALQNGYPITIACMFGTRTIRPVGTPAVQLAEWDDRWAHQQSCFPAGYVVAGESFKEIQNVEIGDMVYGHDGQLHKVGNKFVRTYDGPLVRLQVAGRCKRMPLRLTPEHPMLVYRPINIHGVHSYPGTKYKEEDGFSGLMAARYEQYEETQPQWIAAADIREGDYLLMPIPQYPTDRTSAAVPTWDKSKRDVNIPNDIAEPSDDLAWLFGLYIADGCSKEDHNIEITLHKDEIDYAERAKAIFATLGLEAKFIYYNNVIRVRVYSSCVARSFAKWFGKGSKNKRIPSFMFTGWNLTSLIDGIWAGDGTSVIGKKSDNIKQIATTSVTLREQIFSILLFLGETPSVSQGYWRERPSTWSDIWNVMWGFNGERKNCRKWLNYLAAPVRSTMFESYNGPVFNIHVHEVNSYTVNSLAAHNCLGAWDHPDLGLIFYIMNNWGSSAHPTPLNGEPPGGYWIRASTFDIMLQDEGFAFSGFNGFQVRELSWYI